MTTFFPQIKRVDEDETSKILKNVLFDEDERLEQIFEEFMHLTEESITYSDNDDDYDDDEDEVDHAMDDDDNEDEDEEEEEEEEEEEGEDEDEDDDSESESATNSLPKQETASREPTSWNLDQFIPVVQPVKQPKESQKSPKKQQEKPKELPPAPPLPPPTAPRQQPSDGSCLVQIDLHKLKRIPIQIVSHMSTAKALKHQADAEKDRTKQCMKYLESGMYFLLHVTSDLDSRQTTSYLMELIPLFKHIARCSAQPDDMTNLKIHTLTLRCLSLIFFKSYDSRKRELQETTKIIEQEGSPSSIIEQPDSLLIGVKPQLLSAYTKQVKIFTYLKEAHDNWHKAEYLCDQNPAVRVFLSTIETNCSHHLSMISHLSKLVEHIKCGLKLLRPS